MTGYVALLRAVNVGVNGKLSMETLVRLCESAALERPRTYIASGNVVFRSDRAEAQIHMALAGCRVGLPSSGALR